MSVSRNAVLGSLITTTNAYNVLLTVFNAHRSISALNATLNQATLMVYAYPTSSVQTSRLEMLWGSANQSLNVRTHLVRPVARAWTSVCRVSKGIFLTKANALVNAHILSSTKMVCALNVTLSAPLARKPATTAHPAEQILSYKTS
jgi:hypothetical protein